MFEDDIIVTLYANGAQRTILTDDTMTIKYNTGDEVLFRWEDEEFKVVAIKTHDGLQWAEDYNQ